MVNSDPYSDNPYEVVILVSSQRLKWNFTMECFEQFCLPTLTLTFTLTLDLGLVSLHWAAEQRKHLHWHKEEMWHLKVTLETRNQETAYNIYNIKWLLWCFLCLNIWGSGGTSHKRQHYETLLSSTQYHLGHWRAYTILVFEGKNTSVLVCFLLCTCAILMNTQSPSLWHPLQSPKHVYPCRSP